MLVVQILWAQLIYWPWGRWKLAFVSHTSVTTKNAASCPATIQSMMGMHSSAKWLTAGTSIMVIYDNRNISKRTSNFSTWAHQIQVVPFKRQHAQVLWHVSITTAVNQSIQEHEQKKCLCLHLMYCHLSSTNEVATYHFILIALGSQ